MWKSLSFQSPVGQWYLCPIQKIFKCTLNMTAAKSDKALDFSWPEELICGWGSETICRWDGFTPWEAHSGISHYVPRSHAWFTQCYFPFINKLFKNAAVTYHKLLWSDFIPLKFIGWNLAPKVMLLGGGAFKRQLGHEGAAFKGGIRVFIKEAPEGFLSSFSVEGYNRESVTWKRPLTRLYCHLDSDS